MYFTTIKKIGKKKEWIRVHQARMRGRASQAEGTAYARLTGMRHDGSCGEPQMFEVAEGIRQVYLSEYLTTGSLRGR